jgi:hypothetical protein
MIIQHDEPSKLSMEYRRERIKAIKAMHEAELELRLLQYKLRQAEWRRNLHGFIAMTLFLVAGISGMVILVYLFGVGR